MILMSDVRCLFYVRCPMSDVYELRMYGVVLGCRNPAEPSLIAKDLVQ